MTPCPRASAELVPHSKLLLGLAYFETVIVIILLVNMLIAMMAKTFDNVWEVAHFVPHSPQLPSPPHPGLCKRRPSPCNHASTAP